MKGMMMDALWSGFKTGLAQGWRGYFAPLRLSPWKKAFEAAKRPGSGMFSPAIAWFDEIDRIMKGVS